MLRKIVNKNVCYYKFEIALKEIFAIVVYKVNWGEKKFSNVQAEIKNY